jgi:hypothetical protein
LCQRCSCPCHAGGNRRPYSPPLKCSSQGWLSTAVAGAVAKCWCCVSWGAGGHSHALARRRCVGRSSLRVVRVAVPASLTFTDLLALLLRLCGCCVVPCRGFAVFASWTTPPCPTSFCGSTMPTPPLCPPTSPSHPAPRSPLTRASRCALKPHVLRAGHTAPRHTAPRHTAPASLLPPPTPHTSHTVPVTPLPHPIPRHLLPLPHPTSPTATRWPVSCLLRVEQAHTCGDSGCAAACAPTPLASGCACVSGLCLTMMPVVAVSV